MVVAIAHPQILWAQREGELYVTIVLSDIQEEKIHLTDDMLSFSAVAGPEGKPYAAELKFYKSVDPQLSKFTKTGRTVDFLIKKSESGPYWPRLLEQTGKPHWLKTDFAKWKDEDEEDEPDLGGQSPFGGMDFSSIAGMGDNFANMAMPEVDVREPDSDDEEEVSSDAQQG